MNKITIVASIVIVIAVFSLMIWGKTIQQNNPPTAGSHSGAESALVAPEKSYDFGAISMKNGLVNKEFTVENPTTEEIVISSLVTSCMCTKAYLVRPDGSTKGPFEMEGMGYVPPVNETIKAGEKTVIRVVFDPNAHGPAGVGPVDRFVILTDGTGARMGLEIKAVVTP